jgi:hypothetical protein
MSAPRVRPKLLAALAAAALASPVVPASGAGPLRVEGAFLAVSYDLGQVYGEKVAFRLGPFAVEGRYFRFDVRTQTGWVAGSVAVEGETGRRSADAFVFDPRTANGLLIRYGERIDDETLDPAPPGKDQGGKDGWRARLKPVEDVNLPRIRLSLLYATAKALEIAPNGDVWGYDVMMYVEGIESVGFKKFRLIAGEKGPERGVSLDKLWFTKTQGLFGRASFNWDGGKKLQSSTVISYEEHSILKNYAGLARQLDLQSSTRLALNENLGLSLSGSYNSTSLWNARLSLEPKWSRGRNGLVFDLAYNKPRPSGSETWLGAQSNLDLGALGRLSVQGRYEIHDQALAALSYATTLLKKIQVQAQSNYSRVRTAASGARSEIFSGGVNLAYAADAFQLATDYYLNCDLFGGQRLSRPQFRLSSSPLTFYGGLLTATVQDIFLFNAVKRGTRETTSFSNNTALSVAAKPILVLPSFRFQGGVAVEQFLEKEGRHFTSGGLILRADRSFGSAVSIEGFYSVQSRRKTRGGLIEGTTSQDLSGVLRVHPIEGLGGWISVSYDPKRGEWRQGFADLTVGLIRQWRFQTLLNADLSFGRINNVDLSLIREAGRFDLRFIWRSISKQILVELVPSR